MKKKLTILTLILLVGALLTACTVSEAAPNPNEEISVPEEALPIAPDPALPEATLSTETLEESGVPEENASSESSEVSWAEALEFLNNGEVTLVAQSHDLEVSLVLKDGRTVTAVEPSIDAIFEAVEACGDACSNIVLMTE
jgi:hypothetical protein